MSIRKHANIINPSLTFLSISLLLMLLFSSCKEEGLIVEVESVEKRTIVETVSANGKIQPEIEVKITSEVSGKVTKIYVKEGDEVMQGDRLLTINPDILESTLSRSDANLNNSKAALASSQANFLQAEATFANAQKDYDRQKKLFQDKVISNAEWDAAVASFEVAKSQLESARQNVRSAEFSVRSAEATRKEAADNLGRTIIFAPSDGIITALQVEEGETVLGTIQMAGTELMRVSQLELMEVAVDVNESDIVKVELNDTAIVEVDAYRDRKFKGIVTEIANTASNATGVMSTDQVTNFSVKVRILNDSYADLITKDSELLSPFRTGMSATVEIRTNVGDNMLTVPIEAVTTREDTSAVKFGKDRTKNKNQTIDPIECVFLLSADSARLVPVNTGIQDDRYIHVKSGLKVGDQVIIGPYSMVSKRLKNGNKVRLEKEDKEDSET